MRPIYHHFKVVRGIVLVLMLANDVTVTTVSVIIIRPPVVDNDIITYSKWWVGGEGGGITNAGGEVTEQVGNVGERGERQSCH